ncbi:MAG: LuxR C-terminal-related transcriptional regulator [Methylocystis sp.]|uniref:helix-turn-helix transcriptional regulator n=1 Tax=Methylocystis sp. TaxID=1911079 RepID=UPI003DA2357E
MKKLFGEAREFGICCGLSVPIRGSHGGIAVVTAATDLSVPTWEQYKRENMRKIDVAGALLHRRILQLHRVADQRPKLTRREIECLLWTSQGKTCADVAEILSIAENTARSYLTSARNKLNCLTIAHCVAKAISLQIIPPVI